MIIWGTTLRRENFTSTWGCWFPPSLSPSTECGTCGESAAVAVQRFVWAVPSSALVLYITHPILKPFPFPHNPTLGGWWFSDIPWSHKTQFLWLPLGTWWKRVPLLSSGRQFSLYNCHDNPFGTPDLHLTGWPGDGLVTWFHSIPSLTWSQWKNGDATFARKWKNQKICPPIPSDPQTAMEKQILRVGNMFLLINSLQMGYTSLPVQWCRCPGCPTDEVQPWICTSFGIFKTVRTMFTFHGGSGSSFLPVLKNHECKSFCLAYYQNSGGLLLQAAFLPHNVPVSRKDGILGLVWYSFALGSYRRAFTLYKQLTEPQALKWQVSSWCRTPGLELFAVLLLSPAACPHNLDELKPDDLEHDDKN